MTEATQVQPSNTSESKEVASPKAPDSTGESAKEAQQTSRKLKAIVDGAEIEADEVSALRAFQKEKASEKRFQEAAKEKQEAAQMRKQVDEFISNFQPYLESIAKLKEDPWAVHKVAGIDYESMAYEYAVQRALKEQEEANLDPTQKELKTLKQELEALRKEREAEAKAKEKQKEEALNLQRRQAEMEAAQSLDGEIFEAISELKIKPSERLVARMAEEMLNHLDATGKTLPAKEALKRVRSEVSKFSSDELMSLLPEDLIDALANARSSKKVGKQLTTNKPDQKSNVPRDKLDDELEKFFKIPK